MDNISEIKISQIMTTEVIAANPNNKFSQVFQFFSERNINHIPVVENDILIGIISNKDMVRHIFKHIVVQKKSDIALLDTELKLKDIMTPNPVTVDENTTLIDVKNIFGKALFNCLPVTRDGKLVGIVTPKDIMKMRIIHIDGSDYGGY